MFPFQASARHTDAAFWDPICRFYLRRKTHAWSCCPRIFCYLHGERVYTLNQLRNFHRVVCTMAAELYARCTLAESNNLLDILHLAAMSHDTMPPVKLFPWCHDTPVLLFGWGLSNTVPQKHFSRVECEEKGSICAKCTMCSLHCSRCSGFSHVADGMQVRLLWAFQRRMWCGRTPVDNMLHGYSPIVQVMETIK